MSNKTQLQTNNTNLQSFIDRVNAAKDTAASLPEAGGGSDSGGSAELTIKLNSNLSLDDRCFYDIYFKCAAPDASGAEMSGYSMVTTDFMVLNSFEETFSVKPNSMFTIIMVADEEWESKFYMSSTYTINGERYPDDYHSAYYTYFDASITPPVNSTGVLTINITKK